MSPQRGPVPKKDHAAFLAGLCAASAGSPFGFQKDRFTVQECAFEFMSAVTNTLAPSLDPLFKVSASQTTTC